MKKIIIKMLEKLLDLISLPFRKMSLQQAAIFFLLGFCMYIFGMFIITVSRYESKLEISKDETKQSEFWVKYVEQQVKDRDMVLNTLAIGGGSGDVLTIEKSVKEILKDNKEEIDKLEKDHGIQNYPLQFQDFIFPVEEGSYVRAKSSEFGYRGGIRGYINGYKWTHRGTDFGSKRPIIRASKKGEVVKVHYCKILREDYDDNYTYSKICRLRGEHLGDYIIIKHDDGMYTTYAHLARIEVEIGDYVDQGKRIGLMGATGNNMGPHLHFEIFRIYKGRPIYYNLVCDTTHNYKTMVRYRPKLVEMARFEWKKLKGLI